MLRRLQSRQEPASLQENCEPMLHHYRAPSQIFAVQSVTVPRFGTRHNHLVSAELTFSIHVGFVSQFLFATESKRCPRDRWPTFCVT